MASRLANSVGANYTRYADDLAISGDHRIAKLRPLIGAILLEEGFTPNHRKTRLQRKSTRQRLAGTIVNSPSPNIDRHSYDELKAICTTASRTDGLARIARISEHIRSVPISKENRLGRITQSAQGGKVAPQSRRDRLVIDLSHAPPNYPSGNKSENPPPKWRNSR